MSTGEDRRLDSSARARERSAAARSAFAEAERAAGGALAPRCSEAPPTATRRGRGDSDERRRRDRARARRARRRGAGRRCAGRLDSSGASGAAAVKPPISRAERAAAGAAREMPRERRLLEAARARRRGRARSTGRPARRPLFCASASSHSTCRRRGRGEVSARRGLARDGRRGAGDRVPELLLASSASARPGSGTPPRGRPRTAQPRRLDVAVARLEARAARMEDAGRGRVDGRRHVAAEHDPLPLADRRRSSRAAAPPRAARRCTDGAGARRASSELADLDDAAEVHDRDPVGDLADHREVVRDEDVGEVELVLEAP